MTLSIRKLGIVGATLAIVLIAGLNIVALDMQWDVPFIGVQEAAAWGDCAVGICNRTVGCFYVGYAQVFLPCEWWTACYYC